MKNFKVIYQTTSGNRFKTIVSNTNNVADFMACAYSPTISIISIRPSRKTKYSRFVNVRCN